MKIEVLSAGAAQGVVTAMAGRFEAAGDGAVSGTFGAVGAMRQKLEGGAPCDLIILSAALIDALADAGQVERDSIAPLGVVRTGVAVKAGAALPDVADSAALKACLASAAALYAPDPEKATAGIHFVRVLEALGIRDDVAERLRFFPNGATAMRAMADAGPAGSIGVTQVTEINNTAGVTLVAPLPAAHELATVYALALVEGSKARDAAARFAALLCGPASVDVRKAAGFDI